MAIDLSASPIAAFAGDWHGDTGWALKAIGSAQVAGARVVYQVGDFGVWGGQDGASFLRKVQARLDSLDMLLVVVPGNHENYNVLDRMPVNGEGFQSRPDIDRVWFASRGHVWTHNHAVFAAVGGAGSVDQESRIPGTSWWPQEEITRADIDALYRSMDAAGVDKVNIMLTHEAPAGLVTRRSMRAVSPEIEHYCWAQRVLLREAVDTATPDVLVHGHWHYRHTSTLEGVNMALEAYETTLIGLDMNGSPGNLITGHLAPASGLLEIRDITVH